MPAVNLDSTEHAAGTAIKDVFHHNNAGNGIVETNSRLTAPGVQTLDVVPEIPFNNNTAIGRVAVDVNSRLIAELVNDGMNLVPSNINVVAVRSERMMRGIVNQIVGYNKPAARRMNGGSVSAVDAGEVADFTVVNNMTSRRKRQTVAAGKENAGRSHFTNTTIQNAA